MQTLLYTFKHSKSEQKQDKYSINMWVRSPTASYQRRYKNGTRCFLAWRSAYKDRSGFSLLSNLVQKKRWIPSGMSGRE